jgi:hypothetical protein
VSEDAEDDEENNRGRYPGPELVCVHNFVAKYGNHQRTDGYDDDTGKPRHICIHGVDQLCADNGVDGGPAKAGKDIEDRNYDTLADASELEFIRTLTKLYAVPTKPESREYHLTKSKARPKSGEVANGDNSNQVEEQAHQACISKSKKEELLRQKSNGERGYYHVSGEPLK